MNHPSERLSELINSLSLNINSFSNECGYPSSATIWRIIEQKKKPSNPTINKICNRFPQVNREWLLTGYGEMFVNQQTEYSEDLTVTAKQVIDTIVPKMLKVGLVEKAEFLISKLEGTLSSFELISENIKKVTERLTSIEKQIKYM
jgi:predicted transcriptional regulator